MNNQTPPKPIPPLAQLAIFVFGFFAMYLIAGALYQGFTGKELVSKL